MPSESTGGKCGAVLVVGGTGVAGGAAIAAVREEFGPAPDITALWYGPRREDLSIRGANRSLYGDITAEETCRLITEAAGGSFDYLFFATARGEVGFPIVDSTPASLTEACRFSYDPLLTLEEYFSVGTIVGYSTFYTLEHQKVNYGAMGYAKEKIELWAARDGKSRHTCLRAGAFASDSSRAIKLMLRKHARHISSSSHPLLRSYFSGRRPSEAVALLEKGIMTEEKERYGDSGTTPEDLIRAHRELLRRPGAPFVNVCGRRIWFSEEPQLLPPPAGL